MEESLVSEREVYLDQAGEKKVQRGTDEYWRYNDQRRGCGVEADVASILDLDGRGPYAVAGGGDCCCNQKTDCVFVFDRPRTTSIAGEKKMGADAEAV